ncbi:unnamed protein product [Closterium sp. NIES-53]
MCEAGKGTLLESLKLKGANIPPQREQQEEDEGESDDVVEVDLETKVKDLSAEQAVQAAHINSLSEDMDNLKDSVFKAGDSTAVVVAPGTTRGALHTSAGGPSLARRPLFGQILGFVQAQGATSGAQRSREGDTGPAAGASSSAADQAGAAACVTTAAAGQPGSSASALPAGAGLPGAAIGVSPAAAGQPGAVVVIPTTAAGHPGAEAGVSTAATGQPVAASVIPAASVGQPKAAAGVPTAAAGQPSSAGVALTAAAAQPCATAGAPKAAAGQHGPATGVAINAGMVRPRDDCWDILGPGSDLTKFPPCVQVQDATGSQAADDAPRTVNPAAFLVAAEALDNGSILHGHSSSAPRGTLLNMLSGFAQPSQQVLPSPAASSSFMPSTQVGEEEEAASKGFTGVTKKKGKNEWVARIVLDRSSNFLIVISSHFQSEKFWHKWEQWAECWLAKAKYDEKERKAAMKRAALDRSLGQPDGRPEKMARTVGEGLSRGVSGDNNECVGSKDE